jgi:hypothetical protein
MTMTDLPESTIRNLSVRLSGDKACAPDKLDAKLSDKHAVELIAPPRKNRDVMSQKRRLLHQTSGSENA